MVVRRRSRFVALAAITLTSVAGLGVVSPAGQVAGTTAPTPTPARVGPVGSIAVLGDSISQGTGSDGPGSPSGGIGSSRLEASWATGNHGGLNSYFQRLTAARGSAVTRFNLSANGADMISDFYNQARSVPAGTGVVLVQMGGNDLCGPNEASMTPTASYRNELRRGLDWLEANRPETLVMLYSVPDIYSLWYVRGAAHQGETFFFQPTAQGPRAARNSTENSNKGIARLLWNTLSVIPCQSMLTNPSQPRNAGPTPNPANADEARRLRVRARNVEYNQVLAAECATFLRCRFDSNTVFDFVSNRDANGLLQANKALWTFQDTDISTQDHFHPSFPGQRKLAEQAWLTGYDWSDSSAPVVSISLDPPTPASGWFTDDVAATVSATDGAGVRGLEYRQHFPDGSVSAWTPVIADTTNVTISTQGASYLEARALDINGNTSASVVTPVWIDRIAPVVEIDSPSSDVNQDDEVVADYTCTDDPFGSGIDSCVGPVADGELVDTSQFGPAEFAVDGLDVAGNAGRSEFLYFVDDVTAPTIDISSPVEGAEYVRGDTYAADYSCSDNPGGSGVAWCTGDVPTGDPFDTGTLGTKTFTVMTMDNEGNEDQREVSYTVIDGTDPSIELNTPSSGAVFTLGQPVVASYSCADDEGGSGLATCTGTVADGAPIDTASVGWKTFTVTATDNQGNTSSTTAQYQVVYGWSGVLQPVNRDGSSVFKGGSTVPVKFQLRDHTGALVCDASATASWAMFSGDVLGDEIEAVSTAASTTGNLFRCQDGQHIFNLSTRGLAKGSYVLIIRLADGSAQEVVFSLR
jgi:lysophospholipase L1-like esterase